MTHEGLYRLSGSCPMVSGVVLEVLRRFLVTHKGYTGSQEAAQWSLSGARGSGMVSSDP